MVDIVDEKTPTEKLGNGGLEKKPETPADVHRGDVQTILASSGGMGLFPQPTNDSLDPLNWSSIQKHSVLAIIMFKYFMFTYITTTTVPSFVALQEQYGIDAAQVNWTVAIPALGLAVGPLIWSSLADIYGRRIIFILGTIIALASTIGSALAPSYGGYMAARFFQGLGVSPAATVGLAAINDMFFEHERGQKIGLWVLAIDVGLLVGPIIGGFMSMVSSAWVAWLTAILFGVLLGLEVAFMPETLYPRAHMLLRGNAAMQTTTIGENKEELGQLGIDTVADSIPRTKRLAFINFKPLPGMRHPKPWDSALRFVLSFKFLALTIPVFVFCFTWYWWILSVITMLPLGYPTYAPQIQGLLNIGLLLGTVFSEVFVGGRLSDNISARLTKANGGIRLPEMRLWLAYPAGVVSAVGLILWGVSIDRQYHWMVGQVAFFLFGAGVQIGNTTVCSYIVDAYPLQSMSVITFYSVFLNLSAFIDPFFIVPWQVATGWTWCFAAQGIIVLVGALPAFALLHKFGAVIRQKSGQPKWVNPEYDTSLN